MLEYLKVSMIGTCGTQKTASEDILNFIDRIAYMQEIEDDIQNKDIDRKDIIKTYKKALKETDKFAAGYMYGFDKLQMTMTRVSEMEKAKKEAEKDEEKEL